MARRGGTATEREGRFGTELVCQLAVQTGDGRTANQPSRIIGINGPRWMLRGTLLGRPAVDAASAAGLGGDPAPGSSCAVASTRCRSVTRCRSTLPPDARRASQPDA